MAQVKNETSNITRIHLSTSSVAYFMWTSLKNCVWIGMREGAKIAVKEAGTAENVAQDLAH